MCGGSTKQETTEPTAQAKRLTVEEAIAKNNVGAVERYGFDPAQPGAGVTPEALEAINAFRKGITSGVPFSVASEFTTTYGLFLVADGKSANEAFDIAYRAMKDGDIVFQMWVAGVSGGLDLSETGEFSGANPENALLDAIGATL